MGYNAYPIFWDSLIVPRVNNDIGRGMQFYMSKNELTIEDGMFLYDKRSMKFLDFHRIETNSYDYSNNKFGEDL